VGIHVDKHKASFLAKHGEMFFAIYSEQSVKTKHVCHVLNSLAKKFIQLFFKNY